MTDQIDRRLDGAAIGDDSERQIYSKCELEWIESFGIYRPQAEVFGGRSEGKFAVPTAEISLFQVLINAGDN